MLYTLFREFYLFLEPASAVRQAYPLPSLREGGV